MEDSRYPCLEWSTGSMNWCHGEIRGERGCGIRAGEHVMVGTAGEPLAILGTLQEPEFWKWVPLLLFEHFPKRH